MANKDPVGTEIALACLGTILAVILTGALLFFWAGYTIVVRHP